MDLARAPRRAPLTARKKGSGYENVVPDEVYCIIQSLDWIKINSPHFKVVIYLYEIVI